MSGAKSRITASEPSSLPELALHFRCVSILLAASAIASCEAQHPKCVSDGDLRWLDYDAAKIDNPV
jgi:hypothetical protein